jgi:hypothetical protein
MVWCLGYLKKKKEAKAVTTNPYIIFRGTLSRAAVSMYYAPNGEFHETMTRFSRYKMVLETAVGGSQAKSDRLTGPAVPVIPLLRLLMLIVGQKGRRLGASAGDWSLE